MRMFGRIYDANTHTWQFADGSGTPVPEEMMPQANAKGNISFLGLLVYMTNRDRLAAQIKRNGGKR